MRVSSFVFLFVWLTPSSPSRRCWRRYLVRTYKVDYCQAQAWRLQYQSASGFREHRVGLQTLAIKPLLSHSAT
eukprot:802471-Prorocentrum_minimum.AAC.1